MEVRPGYKQTEVGVIPEDWEVQPLSYLAEIRGGIAKNSSVEVADPISVHYLRVANVQDGFLDFSEMSQIRLSRHDLRRYTVLPGDVLMNEGGDLDKLGRGAIWQGEFNPCVHQNHVFAVRCKPVLLPDYLNVWTATSSARRFFLFAGKQTTNLASISKSSLGGLPVAIPTLDEQRAIAEALSDVDALLDGLDRLIAKKRDLKQAAMQQLLTSQTRLPGFSGEWEVKRLKQVAEISTGINKPLSEMGSGALYVTVQDLYDKTSIRTERLSRIKVSPGEIETRGLTVGDIVFGKSSVKRDGIGYPSQFLGCDEPVVFSGFTYRARARQGIADATFLFYALREEGTRRWLIDNSQASALTNINQTIADAIPVKVPPNLPEQTAIAAVLSDMDVELSALVARRDKTRDLKQAMMQELLTGRTRLVEPVSNVLPMDFSAKAKPAAGIHNWVINEAVVVAVLVKQFGSAQYPLGRKRCTKLSYLLHRHVEHVAQGYLKKAAGPYNPAVKYKGPEGIAQKNGYIRTHTQGNFVGFVAAEKVAQAEGYFEKWYGSDVLAWLEQFRFKSNDELELLATVDMAAEDLRRAGRPVGVDAVKSVIRSHPEWEAKLEREIFSDANLARGIAQTRELF